MTAATGTAATTRPLSVCLFCASADGLPEPARRAAVAFGTACGQRGWRLVYGGSGRGLMGEAARAALAAGGDVVGVMVRMLMARESADTGLPDLRIVETFAERKQMMADLSDLFVALPGGIGTLDEMLEMMTWHDVGLHDKPTLLCDVDGFWAPFCRMLDAMRGYGVLRPSAARTCERLPDVDAVIARIDEFAATLRRI
ncbi:MAG TPA: TIGR00730 family Rossman fold protein [Stellaceae bacterium]